MDNQLFHWYRYTTERAEGLTRLETDHYGEKPTRVITKNQGRLNGTLLPLSFAGAHSVEYSSLGAASQHQGGSLPRTGF